MTARLDCVQGDGLNVVGTGADNQYIRLLRLTERRQILIAPRLGCLRPGMLQKTINRLLSMCWRKCLKLQIRKSGQLIEYVFGVAKSTHRGYF